MSKQSKNSLEWIFLITFTILFIVLLTSCKSKTIYVPVESVKTIHRDKLVKDSIRLYDSIFVDRWKSNDTVFLSKVKYKYIYRDKLIRDTISKIDSISVPYPIVETKTVKALYTWYEKILMALGCIGIGLIVFRIFKWIKR